MTVELRISQTTVKSEAAYLQKILDSVDGFKARKLPAILQGFAAEKGDTKTIEQSSTEGQKFTVNIEKDNTKSEEKTIEILESKTKVLNQERGR
jgi:hypothetical protein